MIRARLGIATRRFGPSGRWPAGQRGAEETLRDLLQTAADARLDLVDASALDGEVERMLGRSWPFPSPFQVATKTTRLADGLDRLEARARRSLERLGLARAQTLLVAEPEDLMGSDGRALWARLQRLKDEGLYRQIGFCADVEDEPVALARRYQPDVVQTRCSLLDQRAAQQGVIAELAGLNVEVHLRSPLSGALLFQDRQVLPPELAHVGPRLSRIRRGLAEAGADPLAASLSYALTLPGVSAVLVGATSPAELRAVIAASFAPSPRLDFRAFALDEGGAQARAWTPRTVTSAA
ncbi:aldo/keto reductase [Brevundimonas sp. 2R-24]|uniref:Aldo/keto reductase n=1 Tax=Peiella sedimenti TaxID=3061083 RepID=A0ABT8SKF9_9CAUL|nr:aldo/keto reductase [Caulobacteraceae bacterium XZ-24]